MQQNISPSQLPFGGLALIERLNAAGYEAWFVGGCVRDLLLGQLPHDWDICTSALPQETEQVLGEYTIHETGLAHGTVLVVVDGEGYEVTTFRTEGTYSDHRRPDSVSFVRDLASDLARRDFTINAMAYHPDLGLVDLYYGQADLASGIIRAVGNPSQRFQEDALRMLRALRFAARLEFTIEPATAQAIHSQRNDLTMVASERVFEELKGVLRAKGVENILCAFPNVFAVIVPEIAPLIDYDQNTPHHHLDAWRHTALTVTGVPERDIVLRLAALLHDIGKPDCCTRDDSGVSHFYGHNQRSQELAHQALLRLRCDTATRQQVEQLIANHDRALPTSAAGVRRFLTELDEDTVAKLLLLKRADVLAQSDYQRERKLGEIDAFEALFHQVQQESACWTMKQLALRGADLIALGVCPGPAMGRMLQKALDAVIEGAVANEKAALLDFLRDCGELE